MTLLTLAKNRFSCRSYENRPIERDKLLRILEAGRVAPSAANKQPWIFIVVDEKDLLSRIKSCYGKKWIDSAPVVIVICGDHAGSWKRDDGKDHCDIDIAIATDHMSLAATDEGLGSCWVCKFDAKKCMKIFDLPANIEPIVLLPIGYPAESADPGRHQSQRLPADHVIRWNGW